MIGGVGAPRVPYSLIWVLDRVTVLPQTFAQAISYSHRVALYLEGTGREPGVVNQADNKAAFFPVAINVCGRRYGYTVTNLIAVFPADFAGL